MKHIQYDANEHSIDRMIEVERKKINHYKMLNTIYKKKSYSLIKEQKQIDRQREVRIKNQLLDKERKWRENQRQINYENNILRNKLLQIYFTKQKDNHSQTKTQNPDHLNQSLKNILPQSIPQQTHQSRSKLIMGVPRIYSNKKIQVEKSIAEQNSKIYVKLSTIQSELMPKLKLNQHHKEAAYFKQMIAKFSPKKNRRMKKIVEQTLIEKPKITLPYPKSYRQFSQSHSNINPESLFIIN